MRSAFVSPLPLSRGASSRACCRRPDGPPARARGGWRVRMGPVEKVTGRELARAFKTATVPLLVDVYAKWCGPCQFLMPELDAVAARFGSRLRVLKMDSDEEEEYARALSVRGLPTLMLVADNQCKYRMEGALTAPDLSELVEHYLFDGPKPSFMRRQTEDWQFVEDK